MREGWPDFVFAFHDTEELGPRILSRLSRHTGLKPEGLADALGPQSPALTPVAGQAYRPT
jgi:hypothetical protein